VNWERPDRGDRFYRRGMIFQRVTEFSALLSNVSRRARFWGSFEASPRV
jgi:hypothetical protein